MNPLTLEAFDNIAEFLPEQCEAWVCTAPQTRRSQERSSRGLSLGLNRYQETKQSPSRGWSQPRLRCDVNDCNALQLTRWWLQKCSGASVDAVNGKPELIHVAAMQSSTAVLLKPPPRLSSTFGCSLSVCCWGNREASAASKNETATTATVPQLQCSLGDLLSLGRVQSLEINGAVLPPTPPEWQWCLAVSHGVEELHIKAGTVPLNELLPFLYNNGSTLRSIEVAGIALPRLQLFVLAPRIEEMVLRNVTVHPHSVIVMNTGPDAHSGAPQTPSNRIPLSDLVPLRHLSKLDLINCKADFDCSGIDDCAMLQTVLLSGCSITDADIPQLGALARVEELLLGRTRVTDVRPLAAMESLRVLVLSNTNITSKGIDGLQTLPNLLRLDLSSTQIRDVNCLHTSQSLLYLNVSKTAVTSDGIRKLEHLHTLENLVLNENNIRDVSFLAGATSLKTLSAQSTLIDSAGIDGFRRLRTLQDLCLAHTRVSKVTELQHCTSLWRLDLQGSLVDEDGIAGLELLPALRVLTLTQTDVADIDCILQSRSLEKLEVKFSQVREPNPFCSVQTYSPLKDVTLTHCEITDVNDLRICGALRSLNLWLTKVTTDGIAGLGAVTTLQEIDLAETEVDSIVPLLECASLQILVLYKTPVESLEGIARLRNLRRLDVAETQISALDDVGQCKHLEILNISNTAIDDDGFAGIEHASALKSILLSFTNVTQLGLLGHCTHLEELHAQACPVTAEGLVGLEKAFRLNKLNFSYTKIQGNIVRFAGCQRLQKLNVKFTNVSIEEIEYIEWCLPHCRVLNNAAQRVAKDVTLT